MNTEEFIKRAIEIYGDEYDYSKTVFVNWNTNVTVTCKLHGDFKVSPRHHIYRHHGCNKCRGKHISDAKKYTKEFVIERCKKIHGDEYDYSMSEYTGMDKEMAIGCKKHGVFKQTPYNHIHKKCGCPKCRYERLSDKYRFDVSELIDRFKEKHGDKYQYPFIDREYINNRSVITIICPIHGLFKQSVMKHLQGQGCPFCNESKLEKEIAIFLEKNRIKFERQMKFSWLKLNKSLSLDFYLPDYNVAIECQGEQHYKPIERFGGEDEYSSIVKRDMVKKKQCINNGVKLLYYTRFKKITGEDIYKNKNKLLKEIFNYGIN
jgi:very-short-patch-repair endonuclease